MKKLMLLLATLLIMCSITAQQKKLSILGSVGYSSETKVTAGNTGLDLVYTVMKTGITPFVSLGTAFHNTFNEASDYGHLSIGLQIKYVSISAGLLIGNNQQKEDIHVIDGVDKILKVGAKTSNFTGQQYTARIDIPVDKTISIIGQAGFANGKTMYRALQTYRLGIRLYIC